jgi:hypothetical protein
MVKTIPDSDYFERIHRLQAKMAERDLDAVLCYADTGVYDNVFYLSKYWPRFEVGGGLVGRTGTPLVLFGGEAPEFGARLPLAWTPSAAAPPSATPWAGARLDRREITA